MNINRFIWTVLVFLLLYSFAFADEKRDQIIDLYNEAHAKYLEGDMTGAKEILENKIIPKDSSFHIAYYLLAAIDDEMKNPRKVIQDINQYFSNISDDWEVYLGRDMNIRRAEKANAFYNRGTARFAIDDFDRAIYDFTELFTFEYSFINAFICGCISAGTSYILSMLVDDFGFKHGVKNDK